MGEEGGEAAGFRYCLFLGHGTGISGDDGGTCLLCCDLVAAKGTEEAHLLSMTVGDSHHLRSPCDIIGNDNHLTSYFFPLRYIAMRVA